MSQTGKENLLSRWSRLKRESDSGDPAAGEAVAGKPETVEPVADNDDAAANEEALGKLANDSEANPPGVLPSLDELGPDSDFRAFMAPEVDDKVRRAALKTLFRHPDFNVTDGLDVYAEDYTKLEKLTPAMVATLDYAKRKLFGDQQGQAGNRSSDHASTDSMSAQASGKNEEDASAQAHANSPDPQTREHDEDKPRSPNNRSDEQSAGDKLASAPDDASKESGSGH